MQQFWEIDLPLHVLAEAGGQHRRTLVVVAAEAGVAFFALAINSKAGSIARAVTAADVALTVATIVDLPITAECTAAVAY